MHNSNIRGSEDMIKLPKARKKSEVSLEEAIEKRRSVRSFLSKDLKPEEISQLLWAAQGITDQERGLRSAPSAGACYPLEVYVVKGDGLFHYIPQTHSLETINREDLRSQLREACLGQSFVEGAPVNIVICAVFERVTDRYGSRGERYVYMEAGHCAQNIHLQAVGLGLASVPVGAFNDRMVKRILNLPEDCQPPYVIPVGYSTSEVEHNPN